MPARFCGQCGSSLPDLRGEPGDQPAVDPWIGRVVDKRYRVLSLIGSGGMGLVYKVEHLQLGKVAAMKVLHADTARDNEVVRRFRTEAQAVSRLSHPNIVQTFDFGQCDGSLYLVMEYVRGDDLAVVVKREGPLPFLRAAPLFVQICSALTEAHEAGVIHRDLKPENIVVVSRRAGAAHAKVLDFGLAKLRERTDGAEITSRGQVIGTPYYMSPEQVRSEELDIRTDIYSLGATFYRVLTGTPPFEAATPVGVLAKHITDPLELPRRRAPQLNLPPAADAIIGRAMAKAREDRYATAAEVQHELEVAIQALHLDERGGRHDPADREGFRPTAVAPTVSARAARRGSSPAGPRPQADEDDSDGDLPAARDDSSNLASGSGSGGRLRKQDFDEFERSLRRRKVTTSVVVPLMLVALASAGFWALRRGGEQASSVEREPNDSPTQATLLPLDVRVRGKIGSRQKGGEPDMDYFRVPAGKGPRVVSARVEGIPTVDLVLELFDGQGTALGKSDAHGDGGTEWLQPTSIGPAEAYLLVRQVWIQGSPLKENVPDPYRLSVHWGRLRPGWEVEPNDWREQATAVPAGSAVKGYLGHANDKDWFSVAPNETGQLLVRLTAPEGVDIVVTTGDAPAGSRGVTVRADKPGELKIPVKAMEPVVVGLSRKLPPGPGGKSDDAKSDKLGGLDSPYELRLESRSAP